MKFNEELFREVLSDDFFREYFDSRENNIRFNTTVINATCMTLLERSKAKEDYPFVKKCVDKILNQCNQMLKLTEVYRNLFDAVYDFPAEKKFIEINDFLNNFCEKANKSVKGKCRLDYVTRKEYTIFTSEKLLTFAMIMCVHHTILSGVSKIKIKFTNKDDKCTITLNFMEFNDDNSFILTHEHITTEYADDIISTIVRKIGCEYRTSDKYAEFVVPLERKGMSMMSAPKRHDENNRFNTFNNILSDITKIK
ncbi:MAG: hypothetical protein K2I00_05695 [Ruminococcus sp.]|nr:hypothetical protein [Ruminococcus sp.]